MFGLPAVNKGDAFGALGYPGDTGPTRSGSSVSLASLLGDYKIQSSKAVDEKVNRGTLPACVQESKAAAAPAILAMHRDSNSIGSVVQLHCARQCFRCIAQCGPGRHTPPETHSDAAAPYE
jgi:hypothetical protein